MEFTDKFGNEIRNATYEETSEYFPVLKKEVIAQTIVSFIVALIIAGMIAYFIIDGNTPMPIIVVVTALFGGATLSILVKCAINIFHISSKKLGVIHVHSEGIDFSTSNTKRPTYYIKSHDSVTGKEICHSITAREYETIRTHFGHLREVDYVVLNPDRIKYKSYTYFFVLVNNGCPVLDSAVYDDIDKSVNNLSSQAGALRVKMK